MQVQHSLSGIHVHKPIQSGSMAFLIAFNICSKEVACAQAHAITFTLAERCYLERQIYMWLFISACNVHKNNQFVSLTSNHTHLLDHTATLDIFPCLHQQIIDTVE